MAVAAGHGWAEFSKRSWPLLVAAAMLAMSMAAQAQMRGGHGHGGTARQERVEGDSRSHGRQTTRRATDPIAALERELPSLRVDLRLSADQVHAWRSFEGWVRAVAEIDREHQRRLVALDGESAHQVTTTEFLAWLAERAQARAQATTELKGHFDALRDGLGDEQRRMLDRRVMQSQTDPLGNRD